MNFSRLWQLVVAGFVCCLFVAPRAATADTFQLTPLHSDQGYFFYGMDDIGHVVISWVGLCPHNCYQTYTNGVADGGISTTAPVFAWDNGTPCSPAVPAGATLIRGICNNGMDAFTGYLPGEHFPGVYFGSGSSLSLISTRGEGLLFMNSLGNVVYDDHFSDTWFLAVRTPDAVPEPSTMVLLGTGVLACVGAVRRRLSA